MYALMPSAKKGRDLLCEAHLMHLTSSLLQLSVCQIVGIHDMQLAAGWEAAAESIWDIGVLQPANSLISFQSYSQEADGRAGFSARWQAQSNTTETHSELVM